MKIYKIPDNFYILRIYVIMIEGEIVMWHRKRC